MSEPSTERIVRWTRHEFHGPDEVRHGPLLHLVYDIPYFDACGVFPSFQIINHIISQGGGDGGMSPGASWEPFQIDEAEYAALAEAVRRTSPATLKPFSRFVHLPFVIDPEFDHIWDWEQWQRAACAKHSDDFHRRLRESGSDAA